MSLFQCEICGCVENTALAFQGIRPRSEEFDFSGIEDRKEIMLCTECALEKSTDGMLTGLEEWHGKFDKLYLPLGEFKTNSAGNLEHIEHGGENYHKYEVTKGFVVW